MTVQELIDKLKEANPDATVVTDGPEDSDGYCGWEPIQDVLIFDDGKTVHIS